MNVRLDRSGTVQIPIIKIEYKEISNSKITIDPVDNEVRIKIIPTHKDLEDKIIALAEKAASNLILERKIKYTYRGTIKVEDRKVKVYLKIKGDSNKGFWFNRG